MRGRIAAAVFLAAAAAAASPALAQRYGGPSNDNYGSPHEMPATHQGPVSHDAVAVAEDLRVHGHCDRAVPMLRRIADRGAGYEISQFDLGLCLLDLAAPEKDAQTASGMRSEAAEWILRAANAGFAKAQAKAVALYMDATGVQKDPVEAEKWALLYHGNAMRFSIGLPELPPDLSSRLEAALNDKSRAEAEARAGKWTPFPVAISEDE